MGVREERRGQVAKSLQVPSRSSQYPDLTVYLETVFKALLDEQFLSTLKEFEKHPASVCGCLD